MTDNALNRPDIQLWLKELRDPNNKQAKGTLREVDEAGNTIGYCCIGLYHAKVLGKEPTGCVRGFYEGKEYDDYIDEGHTKEYDAVSNKIGNSVIYDSGIEMNDNGYTFLQIADMIEEELSGD